MSETYYPPVGFYFSLSIVGVTEGPMVSFKEVSGISTQMTTEEISKGGENRFKYRVPTTAKYENLVLKRGLMFKNSALTKWCIDSINSGINHQIKPKIIIVKLLNEERNTLMEWQFNNAYPIKWSVFDSNLSNTELMIETLEFAYSYFTAKEPNIE